MVSVHRLISRLLLTDNFCWKYKRFSICREKRSVISLSQMKQCWFTPPKHMHVINWNILSLSITISSQIYGLCLSWNVQERNYFLGFTYVACYLYSLHSPCKRHLKLQSLHLGSHYYPVSALLEGSKSKWGYLGRRKGCQPPDKAAWQERAGDSLCPMIAPKHPEPETFVNEDKNFTGKDSWMLSLAWHICKDWNARRTSAVLLKFDLVSN